MSRSITSKLILLLTFLIPSLSWGAVAFDAASVGNDVASTTATHSNTVSNGSLTDGFVTIHICITDDFAPSTISSVTVDGSATGVNLLGTSIGTNGTKREWVYGKVLGTKASGTITGAVTLGTGSESSIGLELLTFSGVDQTTPTQNYATAQGNSTTPSVAITSTTGDLVVDFMCWKANTNGDSITDGANQTRRYVGDGFSVMSLYASTETAAGASTTMNETISTTRQWVTAGAVLKASTGGGGGGAAPSRLPLMGVGP